MRRRTRHAVVSLAVALLVLTGCADGPSDGAARDPASAKEKPDVSETASTSDVPMETVLEDYRAMRTEMVQALDAELGQRDWGVSSNNPEPVRAGCREGEQEDGERVALESFSFRGTYDAADWKRSAEIVAEVGRKHGFTRTGTTVDRDDDLQVFGEDDLGGRYVYGLATNTVLGISTGCHAWKQEPSGDATDGGIEIPDYDKSDG